MKGRDNIDLERAKGRVFVFLCVFATLFGILSLAALMVYVFQDALGWLDWQFLTSTPSRFAGKAGFLPMIVGSAMLISLVAVMALPVGVATAIYLEEYSRDNWFRRIIETNIANLAAVPSIVYGLLGLGLFVSTLGMKHGTVIVGAMTLALRTLPVVIIASQEAIRAVPAGHRRAAMGLGSTKWQMIRTVVLPEALPSIMTGLILALAGALGETAPLVMIGAATSIFTVPRGIFSSFSAMPLQIYAWSDYPGDDFRHGVVPAAIVVLLIILIVMNGTAVFIRHRYTRKRV